MLALALALAWCGRSKLPLISTALHYNYVHIHFLINTEVLTQQESIQAFQKWLSGSQIPDGELDNKAWTDYFHDLPNSYLLR